MNLSMLIAIVCGLVVAFLLVFVIPNMVKSTKIIIKLIFNKLD